jgi:hypothetical protein
MALAFSANDAEGRLRRHLAAIPALEDATMARVPDLDAAGLFAFSVLTATGLAGEITYLVGPDELLTSGTRDDFAELMRRLEVGSSPDPPDPQAFAALFLRLLALRRGVVLDREDGHVLLAPGQLPADKFEPPTVERGEGGVRYRFWIFDTDRFEPVRLDVRVARDGTTDYTATSP